jgi:hypothetical protein
MSQAIIFYAMKYKVSKYLPDHLWAFNTSNDSLTQITEYPLLVDSSYT